MMNLILINIKTI